MYSSRIWNYLQIDWIDGTHAACLQHAKKNFSGPCFTEVLILACWNIWKQRNAWIFKDIRPTFRGWKAGFVHDASLLKYRVKAKVLPLLESWLNSLVLFSLVLFSVCTVLHSVNMYLLLCGDE